MAPYPLATGWRLAEHHGEKSKSRNLNFKGIWGFKVVSFPPFSLPFRHINKIQEKDNCIKFVLRYIQGKTSNKWVGGVLKLSLRQSRAFGIPRYYTQPQILLMLQHSHYLRNKFILREKKYSRKLGALLALKCRSFRNLSPFLPEILPTY